MVLIIAYYWVYSIITPVSRAVYKTSYINGLQLGLEKEKTCNVNLNKSNIIQKLRIILTAIHKCSEKLRFADPEPPQNKIVGMFNLPSGYLT